MAILHNRVSNTELKRRLMEETEKRTTLSFYKYFPVQDPVAFRDYLYTNLHQFNVFGRIYIAEEGINAQISVPESNFESLHNFLYSNEDLNAVRLNIAVEDHCKSFWVLKIKVRKKIVADGIEDSSFSMTNKGGYVNAPVMNAMLADQSTIVVDMRNHYEYEVGHFEKALEIPSDTFRDQLPMAAEMLRGSEDKNIIMYCTGGIRCEKASAYLLHHGFKNVYHLEGGIINYTRQIKETGLESKFIGKNFVFDDRLGERITADIIAQCHQCGKPADTHTNCKNNGCHLLFIQCPECAPKFQGCCSQACTDTLAMPAERQKAIRSGINNGQHIFNKSKARLRPQLKHIQQH